MANSVRYFVCVVSLCLSVSLLNPLSCYADEYFFIFGDSLYDPGNNIFITPNEHIPAYYPPYGTTFFDHSTGRFSDGRVVPDFIAVKLNITFIPPALDPTADFTYGANFASAGAGVFDTNPSAMNFDNQYGNLTAVQANWIAALGPTEANRRLKKAVYLICMGGNDYFSYSTNNPNATFFQLQAEVNSVISHIKEVVEKMYDEIGARKFMFQSVAPLGCMPMFKQKFNITGDGCARRQLTLAALHNGALVDMVESIAKSDGYSEFIYSVFDFYTAIGDRISFPQAYGFELGGVACCGSGSHCAENCGTEPYYLCPNASTHVYFDGGHNTDAANQQISEIMWNGGTDYVSPYNMQQLFELSADVKRCSKYSCSA